MFLFVVVFTLKKQKASVSDFDVQGDIGLHFFFFLVLFFKFQFSVIGLQKKLFNVNGEN